MDEPTADPAIITAYLICREARKQATVFAFRSRRRRVVRRISKTCRAPLGHCVSENARFLRNGIEAGLDALPSLRGTAMKGRVRLAKKMARSASLAPEDRFIRNCTYLDDAQKMNLYTAEVP